MDMYMYMSMQIEPICMCICSIIFVKYIDFRERGCAYFRERGGFIPGVKVFLSERLCHDPLERFFGCQRQRGATYENPTVEELYKNTRAIRVINSFCVETVKGNCQGREDAQDLKDENTPLQKRARAAKKFSDSLTDCCPNNFFTSIHNNPYLS